jgi:16S rRNA processing protein RimM
LTDDVALVRIGKVVRAIGLGGFVGVGGHDGALARLEAVTLRREGDRPSTRRVLEARPQGRLWAVRLEGVEDRGAAEQLVGSEVLVAREHLGEAGEGLHYWSDLEGAEVVTKAGELIGTVAGFLETGAVDVLVVNGERGEVLIPLAPYVRVDEAARKVVVDPPEGLLDLGTARREEKGGPERGG